jgi:hypothetical protein
MYVLASGKFPDSSKLGPLLTAEVKKLHALRDEGIVKGAYRHADHSGVELILESESVETAKARLADLPFSEAGLITFRYSEIDPF